MSIPHPGHASPILRVRAFTSSPAAKVAVSDSFFLFSSPAAGADPTRLTTVRLATTRHGTWGEPIAGLSITRSRLCSCCNFALGGRRIWMLPPAAALSVTGRDVLPGNFGKMPVPESGGAATVPAVPPAQSSSSSSADSDPLVQYVVLRRDLDTELNWPLGALVAQACHAA